MERLDKVLANAGFGSRKQVRQLVKAGNVMVNDQWVKDVALKVNPDSASIIVGGEKLIYRKYVYLLLNKPKGVISATEDKIDKTVIDLLDPKWRLYHPFPVGRLDKDTTGLLLLTNDGDLAHDLLSPRKHVPKTYAASIDGVVDESDQQLFSKGVKLDDGYLTKPAVLKIVSVDMENRQSSILLTISEGKFHQVKRMFKSVGKHVMELERIQMGSLELDPGLVKGEYRELSQAELSRLKGSPGEGSDTVG